MERKFIMKHCFFKDTFFRYCFYGFLFVSILGTLAHFFYDWSNQNTIIGLFTPVNESTWEHMKLLFFPMLIYYIIINYKIQKTNPIISSTYPLSILIGTIAIPVIYYTYTSILGFHLLFLDILTFYLSVLISFYCFYEFTKRDTQASKKIKRLKKLAPYYQAVVLLLAILFLFFSYAPLYTR